MTDDGTLLYLALHDIISFSITGFTNLNTSRRWQLGQAVTVMESDSCGVSHAMVYITDILPPYH